jgi:hypothetical protein
MRRKRDKQCNAPKIPNTLLHRLSENVARTVTAGRIRTILLAQICSRRGWWWRPFGEVLATGIRLFMLVYRLPANARAALAAAPSLLTAHKPDHADTFAQRANDPGFTGQ